MKLDYLGLLDSGVTEKFKQAKNDTVRKISI